MPSAFFGLAPQGTLGAHCGPAPGAGARLARPAGRLSLRFVCPLSPLGAGNTTPCRETPLNGHIRVASLG